jgi:hypothetical protein
MTADYGIPVILYDQVGCGQSMLLPEMMGDTSFWTVDLFMEELENLLKFSRHPALWGAVVRRSAVPEAPDESSGVGL